MRAPSKDQANLGRPHPRTHHGHPRPSTPALPDGGAQRRLQDLLGAPAEAAAPLVPAVAGHRPDAVHRLDAGNDLRHVDPQPGERVGLGPGQPGPPPGLGDRLPYRLLAFSGHPERGERERGAAALAVEQREQYVLGVDGRRPCPFRVLDRRLHHPTGVPCEPLEHQCLPYFLCTACLLTPSSAAISCHDQPCIRALRTCTASSCSNSRRSAATARSPTRGSRSPARAARSVASVMLSTYV